MVFLDGILPQGGEPAVALAQIAANAGDEDDQQRRIDDEADEHAEDMEGKDVAVPAARHRQRMVKADEDDEAGNESATISQVDCASSSTAAIVTCNR